MRGRAECACRYRGRPDGVMAVAGFGRLGAYASGVAASAMAATGMVAVTAVMAPAASASAPHVFGWGLNPQGQVSGTPGTAFLSPVPLPLDAPGVRQVDIGEFNSAAV